MNKTLIGVVIKRLDDAWDWEWRPETRAAFARSLVSEQAGESTALKAVEIAIRHERNRRPSIGDFSRDLIVARQQERREQQAQAPRQTSVDSSDVVALKLWFKKYKPQLMKILARVGEGGTPGSEDEAKRIVKEWKEELAHYASEEYF